jgi:precorrin-6Y C5,15-methyltransferase (decarboxylating)
VPERIVVVGVTDPEALSKAARHAIEAADLVVGGRRHLAALALTGTLIDGDVPAVLDAIAAESGLVCVLASGDPGFFGIVRPLAERFGSDRIEVHPAPSSVAVAFARLGLPWDDAVVVSAHGRPLADAVRAAVGAKIAVLTSPDNSPEALGQALLDAGVGERTVAVCSRLGLDDEVIERTDLPGLAARTWDPLSVVVLVAGDSVGPKSLAWGLPDSTFEHRAGMVTKAEVRAVVLGKLDLPVTGVVWDVGAGSGSVAVEIARLRPGVRVFAVERRTDDTARIRANAATHGVTIEVVEDEAPGCLDRLPDPDRVFIGGGGLDVLDAVLRRSPRRVVATYAALDRAAAAADRLGNVVQVGLARGERLPDGGLRLAAENPVFVVWGDR